MKRVAACILASSLGAFTLSAWDRCEPERQAERYPSLAGRTVTVATTPFCAPYSYADPKNNGRLVDSDIEVSEAALDCVELKYEYLRSVFLSLLQNISSSRAHVMAASLYCTPERNKVADSAAYMRGGGALLVRKGNPHEIASMDDPCGLTTNAVSGSYSHPFLLRQQEKYRAEGEKDLVVVLAVETDAALRGLTNGRADFMLDDVGAAAVRVRAEPGTFETASTNVLIGNAVRRGNDTLPLAYRDGIRLIQEDGTIGRIFDEYGLDRKLIHPVETKN